ncbi:indolepyruvate oxidoreductase subunit beta [Spirochaeta isovalerica]|uniref:Indolepyruvate ferredoxin oxidoreductase beta subunit n=1 Tax=Spirochaeta isovalerica TaxID=150 RepID=A0A841R4Q3_9SPIO|nr:indolepyruvate oxidoreductase subunit beta [Spirochaeta isovalerica]MBB6478845.1 indolepyruvate ferredoxin oxidoreductase beta subunit [Spirochaeta isovalerica]
MTYNIVLCGVGGQGVLSVAAIIARGAMMEGLQVKQAEVHGMSQRGGAVIATMRISSEEIFSDLISEGQADMILSMEPLESIRHISYLRKGGQLITGKEPFINIPEYPEQDKLYSVIDSIPGSMIIDTKNLAVEAGSQRAQNMVLVGSASKVLPIKEETFLKAIENVFTRKGEEIVTINKKAFVLGRNS